MTNAHLLMGMAKPERRASLGDSAYQAVKQAIRDGVFPPGYQGSELDIAQRLGMSRTPVHQAIIRLEAEGMVELLPRRGVVISALSAADLKEVYDVITAVEGMAALLLAERGGEEREAVCADLDRIDAELDAAVASDDLDAWADIDARFHARLVSGSGNGRLERIATVTADQSYRARRLTLGLRPRPVHSVAEHSRIVAAIRAGEPGAACEAAQEHKIRARDLIVALLTRHSMKHL